MLLVVGLIVMLGALLLLPRDLKGLASFALLYEIGLLWGNGGVFFTARVTPTHVELDRLFDEIRIPLENVASVKLRVDFSGARPDPEDSPAQQARDMDAATKYRVWVTSGDADEYKSVRFEDVARFYALQRALQFTF